MDVIMMNILLATAISVMLIILNSTISKKNYTEREKPSAFECGFDPKSSARLPFSLRFYIVAVVFLIFDVEITLIMPMPMLMLFSNAKWFMAIVLFFLSILLAGLYHEWNQGALDWDV